MNFTIIIPTLNEEENLPVLSSRLIEGGLNPDEIIVVDGGSQDKTLEKANELGIKTLNCPRANRAAQLNYGASIATGDWLYFIHADTIPPVNFLQHINKAIEEGFNAGCFRSSYNTSNILLKINEFFTRYNKLWCRGGDQTLFIKKSIFEEIGGFSEKMRIMEDFDIIEKLQEGYDFKIMRQSVLISARKYRNNSYLKVQLANLLLFNMYKKRVDTDKMISTYHKLLKLP